MEKVKPLFLRPREAAALIGASRSKLYEMISKGQIPTLRIGGLLRIPAASLDLLVEQAMREPENRNAER